MSERSSRSTDRYRYGYCINPECKQRGRKNVQKKSLRDDFVCDECKHDLQECARPKTFMEKYDKLIYTLIGLIVVAAIALFFILSPKKDNTVTEPIIENVEDSDSTEIEKVPVAVDTAVVVTKIDTVMIEKEVVREVKSSESSKKTSTVTSSNGSIKLSYGEYTGDTKNGYPEGMGRLTYTKPRVINKFDSKARTANAGDYIIGEFVRGFVVQGKHYSSDGNLIETLMIGTPASNAYEQK